MFIKLECLNHVTLRLENGLPRIAEYNEDQWRTEPILLNLDRIICISPLEGHAWIQTDNGGTFLAKETVEEIEDRIAKHPWPV